MSATFMLTTSKPWLPVEIYEAIISLVTSTKDLLNLSLTCRQLCELIIPNHIDYLDVVCSRFDSFVWEHFLNNPHLAKGIYSIKVLDNVEFHQGTETETGAKRERRVIPRELQTLSTQELESVSRPKAFTESFSVMKDLHSFDYRGPWPAFLLFTHLAHCASGLRIFKYKAGYDRYSSLLDIIDNSASQVNKGFEYLECCSLNVRLRDKYDNHAKVLSMVNHLLDNNNSLKSLTLYTLDTSFQSIPIPIPKFLLNANWPKIHTLVLGGNFRIFENDIDIELRISQTQAFFFRHASLEKVRIRGSWNILIYPGTLQPDMLPKLHTLDLTFRMLYPVSELIPENMINRLVNLSANLSRVPDSFITSGHLKNIRRFCTEVPSYDRIPILLRGIPNIECLQITLFHLDSSTARRGEEPGVLHLLSYFVKHNKNLTHLSLILPFYVEDFAPENYARELDRLEFIYFPIYVPGPIDTSDPWFRVIRSPSGTMSLERHLANSDECTLRPWMGFDSLFE